MIKNKTQKVSNKQKGLILVLTAFLIIIGVGGFNLYEQSKPEQVANKLLENSSYISKISYKTLLQRLDNKSFKYPLLLIDTRKDDGYDAQGIINIEKIANKNKQNVVVFDYATVPVTEEGSELSIIDSKLKSSYNKGKIPALVFINNGDVDLRAGVIQNTDYKTLQDKMEDMFRYLDK